MKLTCFLDMDGVLTDFNKAVCTIHQRPFPYDDPANLGIWEIDSIWGISASEFWRPINTAGIEFWSKMPQTEAAGWLVNEAIAVFGNEVGILTSPSLDPYCVPGKRQWMKDNFPMLAGNMVFTSAKHLLAHPGALLIDDRDKNVESFRAAGGRGLVFPAHQNSEHLHTPYILRGRIGRLLQSLEVASGS